MSTQYLIYKRVNVCENLGSDAALDYIRMID